MIACTAIEHEATLVTHDGALKDGAIVELVVEDWLDFSPWFVCSMASGLGPAFYSRGRAERTLWAFVMVLSYSRQVFLRFFLGASMPFFTRGHVDAFAF